MSDKAACACLTVNYAPEDLGDGTVREKWVCASGCGSVFSRGVSNLPVKPLPGDIGEALEGVQDTFADIYQRANFSQSYTPEGEGSAGIPPEAQAARLFGDHLTTVRQWVGDMRKWKSAAIEDNENDHAEIARLQKEATKWCELAKDAQQERANSEIYEKDARAKIARLGEWVDSLEHERNTARNERDRLRGALEEAGNDLAIAMQGVENLQTAWKQIAGREDDPVVRDSLDDAVECLLKETAYLLRQRAVDLSSEKKREGEREHTHGPGCNTAEGCCVEIRALSFGGPHTPEKKEGERESKISPEEVKALIEKGRKSSEEVRERLAPMFRNVPNIRLDSVGKPEVEAPNMQTQADFRDPEDSPPPGEVCPGCHGYGRHRPNCPNCKGETKRGGKGAEPKLFKDELERVRGIIRRGSTAMGIPSGVPDPPGDIGEALEGKSEPVRVIKKLDNIRVNLTRSPLPGHEFVVVNTKGEQKKQPDGVDPCPDCGALPGTFHLLGCYFDGHEPAKG